MINAIEARQKCDKAMRVYSPDEKIDDYIALAENKIQEALKVPFYYCYLPWKNTNSFQRRAIENYLQNLGYKTKRNEAINNQNLIIDWCLNV